MDIEYHGKHRDFSLRIASPGLLQLTRNDIFLLMGMVTAVGTLLTAILPYYWTGPEGVLQPIITFITGMTNLIVYWLNNEPTSPASFSPPSVQSLHMTVPGMTTNTVRLSED